MGENGENLHNFVAEFFLEYVRMRFLGNIEAKTDAKGRAFLPAVFRKVLQASGEENLVLRKDIFQQCLVLFPESVWNQRVDLLKSQLKQWKPAHQQILRQFRSRSSITGRQWAIPDFQTTPAGSSP